MKRYLALLLGIGFLVLALRTTAADEPEAVKPVNINEVNTDQDEDTPHVSTTGLQLFYASNAGGKWAVQVSRRANLGQAWPAGKALPELEGMADFRSVFLLDARYPVYLYFASNKDPETEKKGDNFDLYYRAKQGPGSDFTGETAVISVDTAADEVNPWLTPTGQKL